MRSRCKNLAKRKKRLVKHSNTGQCLKAAEGVEHTLYVKTDSYYLTWVVCHLALVAVNASDGNGAKETAVHIEDEQRNKNIA